MPDVGIRFPCGTKCRGMQSIAKDADCRVASSILLAMTGGTDRHASDIGHWLAMT